MRRWHWLAAVATLFAIAIGTALLTLKSDWFRNKVRERIVSEIERTTGGRVEIGEFRYQWRALHAEVSPFVLHGTEPSGAPPLFRADRIQIGLRVLSVVEKNVDVQEIAIDRPQFHVTVDTEGKSNIPLPKIHRQSRGILQRLLDLKVSRFALRNGYADYNEARVPLDFTGTDVAAGIRYGADRGPYYEGTLTAREVRGNYPSLIGPLTANFKTILTLRNERLELKSLQLERGGSHVELSGDITNWSAPKGEFNIQAKLLSRDLAAAFHFPASADLSYSGKGWFDTFPFSYRFAGAVKGRVQDVTVASDIEASPGRLSMPHAHLNLLGGAFDGAINLAGGSRLSLQGQARNFPVQQLIRFTTQKLDGVGGTASGPVKATARLTPRGLEDLQLEADVTLTPGAAGLQLSGPITVHFDQRAGKLALASSGLTLGSTQVQVAGTVGESVEWHIESRNLNDVLAALDVAGRQVKIPDLELLGGVARFDGSVSGPIDASHVAGKIQLTNFRYQQQKFDRFSAQIDLTSSLLTLHSFSLDQASLHAQGTGATLGLTDWQPTDSSPVSATLTATGIPLHEFAAGTASATFNVKGTLGDPAGSGSLQAANLVAHLVGDDEQIPRASAQAVYTNHTLTISNGELVAAGGGKIVFTGSYRHDPHDLQTGQIRFVLSGSGIGIGSLHHVQDLYEGLSGQTAGKATGAAKLTKGVFDLVSLEAEGSIRDIQVDQRPLGNVALQANTHEGILQVEGHADLRGTQLTGIGQWELTGDYPGTAQIEIPQLTAATLHDLSPGEHMREKLPFEGFLQGTIRIEGLLKKPDSLRARAIFDKVQINADPTSKPLAGALAKDLVIANSKPVLLRANNKSIEIESAEFAAKDSTIRATGKFSLDSKTAWDLKLSGNVNLTILQIFNPDLLGAGSSVINIGVRGTFQQPDVDGRLELKSASLFLKDVPNGIDNANGVILFDRNRANIESLSATSGGGKVVFQPGSFLGFRGATVTYRLQAEAQDVRYRTPDGLSVTVAAALSLVGTSDRSVLSGTVTILKAGLSSRTDIGSLLAATTRPISTPTTSNEYLRGLQFDLRLLSSQNLQLQTYLTHDVQAEANLRIRGTPSKPVVLGKLTVNAGEIDFFGNRYSITRGEVSFLNPAKIDPVLDMDLETKVRGIVVDIRFSGALSKLNFSYRSDPPFQPSQIIALLAVGRVPTATGGLASSQTGASSGFLATSSNELVNQATAPTNGTLERFFGVSHIKIDPSFTDVTAVPQARLTLEQQISKEVTLTYTTNLTREQEQLIRVEWDLSRQWALVALRDESGSFGIDVLYKKRFK